MQAKNWDTHDCDLESCQLENNQLENIKFTKSSLQKFCIKKQDSKNIIKINNCQLDNATKKAFLVKSKNKELA